MKEIQHFVEEEFELGFESFMYDAGKRFRELSEQILENPNEQKVDELLNILEQIAQYKEGRNVILNTVKNYEKVYIIPNSPITRDYIIPFVKKNKRQFANSNQKKSKCK